MTNLRNLLSRMAAALLLIFALTRAALATPGAVVAIGGGTEDYGAWSDEVYGFFVAQAAFGHIAVVANSPQSEWIPEYLVSLGAESAVNVIIPDRLAADSDEVVAALQSADGIFLKGGDQALYVRRWKDTKTETILKERHAAGAAIAGTSAGCAVLSEIVYDALHGSLQPEAALRDGRPEALTLTHDFLGLVPGVLFDTHFTQRGRLPRLLAMLAATREDSGLDLLGIGVDHKTALAITAPSTAEVMGEGSVTILQWTPESAVALRRGRAPSILDVRMDALTDGFVYDLSNRAIVTMAPSAQAVPETAQPPPPPGMGLWGSDEAAADLGEAAFTNLDVAGALESGLLHLVTGNGTLPGMVVMPRAYANPDTIENTAGGTLYALAKTPHALGILLDTGAHLRIYPGQDRLEPALPDPPQEPAVLLIDTAAVTHVDFSAQTAVGASAPRQSVALVGARVHLTSRASLYRLSTHRGELRTWP